MEHFMIHTHDSAPEGAKETLVAVKGRYGFLPNLMAAMAEAPPLLRSYVAVGEEFARGTLTPVEQQIVILAVSRRHECEYCVAAHSGIAKMAGIPKEELDALRNGSPLQNPRFEALRRFTEAMVENRGWVSNERVDEFLRAGFTRAQVLEVILGLAFKTMSNFTNHVVGTPLDKAFEAFAWSSEGVTEKGILL